MAKKHYHVTYVAGDYADIDPVEYPSQEQADRAVQGMKDQDLEYADALTGVVTYRAFPCKRGECPNRA